MKVDESTKNKDIVEKYTIYVEALINIAVKQLVGDIDFVRNLWIGKVEME